LIVTKRNGRWIHKQNKAVFRKPTLYETTLCWRLTDCNSQPSKLVLL